VYTSIDPGSILALSPVLNPLTVISENRIIDDEGRIPFANPAAKPLERRT
jgi:hypothetical protein